MKKTTFIIYKKKRWAFRRGGNQKLYLAKGVTKRTVWVSLSKLNIYHNILIEFSKKAEAYRFLENNKDISSHRNIYDVIKKTF